ncbi:MAG: hypothetical protein EOP40_07805 [Rubrivivax sp.]|nr:MAG: hypothetical protein EOP40_07805 [Rubrivivax sp.]
MTSTLNIPLFDLPVTASRATRWWRLLVVIAVLGMGSAAANAGTGYRFVLLGEGQATGINNKGQIVGVSQGAATLWEGSTKTTLGGGGSESWASDINDAGQVVGWIHRSGESEAALWNTQSSLAPIGLGRLNGTASQAYAINDTGQIVGVRHSRDPSGRYDQDALQWTDGTASVLLRDSIALDINNAGQVVGSTGRVEYLDDISYAFVAQQGQTTILPARGSLSGTAWAINDVGTAVGTSTGRLDANEPSYAMLWNDGAPTDLGIGEARDINDAGQVVGSLGGHAAAVSHHGVVTNLGKFAGGTGWSLAAASAINDSGWIVGHALNRYGRVNAYVLIPVPEPAAYAMVVCGGAMVGALAWRRKRRAPGP